MCPSHCRLTLIWWYYVPFHVLCNTGHQLVGTEAHNFIFPRYGVFHWQKLPEHYKTRYSIECVLEQLGLRTIMQNDHREAWNYTYRQEQFTNILRIKFARPILLYMECYICAVVIQYFGTGI